MNFKVGDKVRWRVPSHHRKTFGDHIDAVVMEVLPNVEMLNVEPVVRGKPCRLAFVAEPDDLIHGWEPPKHEAGDTLKKVIASYANDPAVKRRDALLAGMFGFVPQPQPVAPGLGYRVYDDTHMVPPDSMVRGEVMMVPLSWGIAPGVLVRMPEYDESGMSALFLLSSVYKNPTEVRGGVDYWRTRSTVEVPVIGIVEDLP